MDHLRGRTSQQGGLASGAERLRSAAGAGAANESARAPARPPLQVLDRVVTRLGGQAWWLALGSRLKAQRAVIQAAAADRAARLDPLWDSSNYGACARLHVQMARCGRGVGRGGVVELACVTRGVA